QVGRAAAGGVRAARGCSRDGRRAQGVPRAAVREVVDSRARGVRHRDPEDERRQVPQDRAARAVLRRAGADDVKAAVVPAVDAGFELRDVPDPVPQEGEALVRVRAAGINFLDILIRRGRYPQMPDLPAVLGVEVAGELEDGTRVMAMVASGGYAELAAVPQSSLAPLPGSATVAAGAGFLLTVLTAD